MLNISLRAQIFITIIAFFIVGWFLFTYRILEVPPGINGDEAVIGYNAALVSKNGYDSNNVFLPLFISVPGSNDWKQPITFYAEILAFRIFGPSFFTLRAVSVFFVLVSGILIFFLIKELRDFKTALVGLSIFATIPIVMIQSHLALENIAPVPFIAFWLWMIIKYAKEMKIKYLVLGAIALSLGLYSYLGLRLIVPVLAFLNIILVYYLNRKSPSKAIFPILIFIITVLPFLLFFLVVKGSYPGSFLGLYRPYNIISYQQFFLPYLSTFDPSFLFVTGDVTPYHSTGKQGMFLLSTLPFFIYGLVKILQNKQRSQIFILLSFFLTPILFGFASDIHRASRLLALIPFYTVITSIGVIGMFEIIRKVNLMIHNKIIGYTFILLMFFLIILNYADFLRDYWYEYPNRIKSEFAKPYQLVFEKTYYLSKQNNLAAFIQSDLLVQNPIALDFFREVYFPGNLKLWKDDQLLPENSVIIVTDNNLSKREKADQIKIGESGLGILINKR